MKSLEDRPSVPRKQRQKTWSTAMILAVRQSEDGRGRGKVILQMLLADRGWDLSVSIVGRILAYLKEQGRLPEPDVPKGRKPGPTRPYANRRPKGTPPPPHYNAGRRATMPLDATHRSAIGLRSIISPISGGHSS